jgi:energy-converting hydrogenase Eha subunit C
MNIEALDKWHKTRLGHLTFGFMELLAAYLFVSLAINSGSLIEYTVTIILFAGAVQNFVKIFKPINNEQKRR